MIICDFCKTTENVIEMYLPIGISNINYDTKQCDKSIFEYHICFECYINECKEGYLKERMDSNKKYSEYILKLINKEII